MSSFRPILNHNLQNYPKIHVDRGSVIRPCNADQAAVDQFIGKHKFGWRQTIHALWHEGMPYLLRWLTSIKVAQNANPYYTYLTRAIHYLAFILLHIHRIFIQVYGYFFPYSLLPLDEVCDEFSRCPRWSEAVIRAFAWHPNQDRCALAICNDYIHVYQGSSRIRVLRHAQQRKITDMAWQPSNREILVVATQTKIIIWTIGSSCGSHLNILRDTSRNSAYLTPGLQLIMRAKESPMTSNGSSKQINTSSSKCDSSNTRYCPSVNDFKLLSDVLPAPIISIQFDLDGSRLYVCSPNSSKIAILNIERLLNQEARASDSKQTSPIQYLMKYGQGMTRLLWSPDRNRLATATTSSFVRVFEAFNWSCNNWSLQGNLVQDFVWSKPNGRMLLVANKSEPFLYALSFLDKSQPGDVGGNKSLMKSLDLTATQTESGEKVGGLIQALAWDKGGKRLAISFKDNPESILLYRTVERPTVEFYQLGIIQSESSSAPLLMEFHDNFKSGSLLTVCWNDGSCQHIPMSYAPDETIQIRNGLSNNDDSFSRTLNNSSCTASFQNAASPARTPRSLTNFCHVSGNNSITSFKSSLKPLNRVQHQTTLFSLSSRSLVESSEDSSDLIEKN